MRRKSVIALLLMLVLVPAVPLLAWKMGSGMYYLTSALVILLSLAAFLVSYESRHPSARDLVVIAVMTAIGTVSRAAFIMLPNIKPVTGIIMITGASLGPEAGFLTGILTAFVSNFFFGQGPWTPWQMFAYGLGGLIMGLLCKKGLLNRRNIPAMAAAGGLLVLCLIGPLLDTGTLFLASAMTKGGVAAVYAAGLPVNLIHAVSTALTILFLCRPIDDKLTRIKRKYGLMEVDK